MIKKNYRRARTILRLTADEIDGEMAIGLCANYRLNKKKKIPSRNFRTSLYLRFLSRNFHPIFLQYRSYFYPIRLRLFQNMRSEISLVSSFGPFLTYL